MAMSLSAGRDAFDYAISCLVFSVLLYLDSRVLALHFPSSYKRLQSGDDDTAMLSLRDNNSVKPSPAAPQARLHPGVVAAVVVVSLMAIVAAVFIIKKYCFQQSEATYRYSTLRAMEEEGTAEGAEDSDTDLEADREESDDEDLLE
ncbi:hypothetical protein AGOR_G00080340 [Albula goreensis]|uniref:Uncharacterized protein n=1 Tax=Albula goreensis TaxID=1534307 RepID=A0A8T3DJK9_9TELE|nr:hypothetical protein AGOR_G00080340 [Albula goreensis]